MKKYLIYSNSKSGSGGLTRWLSTELGIESIIEPLERLDNLDEFNSYIDFINSGSTLTKCINQEASQFINKCFQSSGYQRIPENIKGDEITNLSPEFNKKINDFLIKNQPSNSVFWELQFLQEIFEFDKIIILTRNTIIHRTISQIVNNPQFSQYMELLGRNTQGVEKYKINENAFLKDYGHSFIRDRVIESYDTWLDLNLTAEFFKNSIAVSYEGIFYKMDDSIERIKNFLDIDYFKSISMINFSKRDRQY